MTTKTKNVKNKGIISETKSREEIILSAPCTDMGNAELLAKLYGDEFRYVKESSAWLYFDGNFWKDDRQRAYRTIPALGREIYAAAPKLRNISGKKDSDVYEKSKWGLNMERDSYIENT